MSHPADPTPFERRMLFATAAFAVIVPALVAAYQLGHLDGRDSVPIAMEPTEKILVHPKSPLRSRP